MPGNDQQEPRRWRLKGLVQNALYKESVESHERLSNAVVDALIEPLAADEQATRQSARAEALRQGAEKLRERAREWSAYERGPYDYAADFLEWLASDNEGKADHG
jgi:hypothetical protein